MIFTSESIPLSLRNVKSYYTDFDEICMKRYPQLLINNFFIII